MIAMTSKNGNLARLYADFHLDTANVCFYVTCGKVRFEFPDFAPAARVYKTLSERIESENLTDACIKNLVAGARALGYNVEVA